MFRLPAIAGPTLLGFASCMCLLTLINTALAQVNSSDLLITRATANRDALRVQTTLETPPSGVCGIGKISIIAPRPSPSDRDFVLVVYLKPYGSSTLENTAYRHRVRLAEGTSRTDLEFVFTNVANRSLWDIVVLEDGRDIENKPKSNSNSSNNGLNWMVYDDQYAASLSLLAAGEDAAAMSAEVERLAKLANPLLVDQQVSAMTGMTGVPPVWAKSEQVSRANLDWRSYLSYDSVVLTGQAVVEAIQRPALAEALRTSVLAGASMVISRVTEPAELEAIDQLFGGRMAEEGERISAIGLPVWQAVQMLPLDADMSLMENLKQRGVIQCELGFGRLTILDRSPDQFPVMPKHTYVPAKRVQASVSVANDGNWFWRNLIQKVGKPPVWMFCTIVTLFGALLGPGLLVFTGRLRRRSLMIFLVPTISLVASLAIVVYGLVNEGMETHQRIVSVQAIYGETQMGFVWSRQNFFSGLPPREGLQFSPRTFARRTVSAENDGRRFYGNMDPRAGVTCTIDIGPDEQRWSGWLRPRQQQQLLVGHPLVQVTRPINVKAVNASKLLIENRTSGTLPIVLIRGAKDDYYVAEDLAAASSIEVESIDVIRAQGKIAKLMVDYRPETPPELGEGGSLLDFGSRYSTAVSTAVYPDILNNSFERWMSDKLEIPRFGFAVLTTESTAVEIPLEGSLADDLHLIVGVQPW